MEEGKTKKGKGSTIVIILLIIIILGLVGYIYYSSNITSKESKNEKNTSESSQKTSNDKIDDKLITLLQSIIPKNCAWNNSYEKIYTKGKVTNETIDQSVLYECAYNIVEQDGNTEVKKYDENDPYSEYWTCTNRAPFDFALEYAYNITNVNTIEKPSKDDFNAEAFYVMDDKVCKTSQAGDHIDDVYINTSVYDKSKTEDEVVLYSYVLFKQYIDTQDNTRFKFNVYSDSSLVNKINDEVLDEEKKEIDILQLYKDKASKYKHTFKKTNKGHIGYYWYSTEKVE